MQGNPAEDWQRLTEHYREISDEELEELADDFGNLTATAQQVLRSEMKNRGLAMPGQDTEQAKRQDPAAPPRFASTVDPGFGGGESDSNAGDEEDGGPREFTWKTPLCECNDQEQAWEIHEVLQRAGIESWVEQPGSRYSFGISSPRILVAADQLDEARAIAAGPMPQEIIDQSKMGVPEFEAPSCPKCGAPDPVLESVDPSNSWLCEACGKQWSEPETEEDGEPEKA